MFRAAVPNDNCSTDLGSARSGFTDRNEKGMIEVATRITGASQTRTGLCWKVPKYFSERSCPSGKCVVDGFQLVALRQGLVSTKLEPITRWLKRLSIVSSD